MMIDSVVRMRDAVAKWTSESNRRRWLAGPIVVLWLVAAFFKARVDGFTAHSALWFVLLIYPGGLLVGAAAIWGISAFFRRRHQEWADFAAARFGLLAADNPELARRLSEAFVDTFLSEARLSSRRRDQALEMLVIESGRTPKGRQLLQLSFPFTGSTTTVDWDGSESEAEGFITSTAKNLADDVAGDRSRSGATGWEPEYDNRP